MPYIKDTQAREELDNAIYLHFSWLKPKGYLNYFLFKLAKVKCTNYNEYKEFIGELEMCKMEIYRRLIAPYEDKKKDENGDVEWKKD